jgi:hypothetical protein
MKKFIILFFPIFLTAQEFSHSSVDTAFLNAKKGVYWCLGNIPAKKGETENQLIIDDKLISSVKLQKDIGGIKIESTGYYFSTEVKITYYKSLDNLLKEGFIKPDSSSDDIKDGTDKPAKRKRK